MLVPRVGLEPTTLSLEVSCSIQLSYRGAVPQVLSPKRGDPLVVRDGVVETPSQVWKTCILTVIRIPLAFGVRTGVIIADYICKLNLSLVDDGNVSSEQVQSLGQVFVPPVNGVNVA